MLRILSLTLVTVVLATVALPQRLASAQEPPQRVPLVPGAQGEGTVEPETELSWYGGGGLLFDTAAIAAVVGGVASGQSALVGTGIGIYAVGAPAMHAAHGHE